MDGYAALPSPPCSDRTCRRHRCRDGNPGHECSGALRTSPHSTAPRPRALRCPCPCCTAAPPKGGYRTPQLPRSRGPCRRTASGPGGAQASVPCGVTAGRASTVLWQRCPAPRRGGCWASTAAVSVCATPGPCAVRAERPVCATSCPCALRAEGSTCATLGGPRALRAERHSGACAGAEERRAALCAFTAAAADAHRFTRTATALQWWKALVGDPAVCLSSRAGTGVSTAGWRAQCLPTCSRSGTDEPRATLCSAAAAHRGAATVLSQWHPAAAAATAATAVVSCEAGAFSSR